MHIPSEIITMYYNSLFEKFTGFLINATYKHISQSVKNSM